jgi:triosephosphate isomerase
MQKFVIGNWKCHKGVREAKNWFTEFARRYRPTPGLTIIVAPSFLCLPSLADQLQALGLENVALAAQDISPYPQGSYTGAVAADMVKDLVEFVILGHAERRRYFQETDQIVAQKMAEVVDAGLIPIVCVDQPYAASQLLALNADDGQTMIIAYGPQEATTARIPESPVRTAETAQRIASILPARPVVYGGALAQGNVRNYLHIPSLAGLFVGQASLRVDSFLDICAQMAQGMRGD